MRPEFDFRAVFESMGGLLVLVDASTSSFRILACTNDYLKPLGQLRSEIYGESYFDASPLKTHPSNDDVAQQVRASFQKVIESRQTDLLPILRYDLPDAGGAYSEHYWQVENIPILDSRGNVSHIINSVRDVTESVISKSREARIRGFEPAYNLFRQAPVAIAIVKGPDKVIDLANDSILDVWGKGPDVSGKKIADVLPELEPQGILKLIDEVRETGIPYYAFEKQIHLIRNGIPTDTWFTFHYQPYYEDASDRAAGIMIFAHEVTDKVKAAQETAQKEHAYRQALIYKKALLEAHNAASFDGILLINPEGEILSWNQRFVEIWDFPPEVLKAGDDPEALKYAEKLVKDPQTFRDRVRQIYDERVHASVDILELKNGRFVERHGYAVIGEDGQYYGWSWVFRDITENRQMVDELRQSESRHRELSQSLEQLVADRTATLSQLNETHNYAEEIGRFGSYRYHFNQQKFIYSDNFYRLVGCEPHELPRDQKSFAKFIHPEDREHVMQSIEQVIKCETIVKWEYRLIRKNAETIYVRGTGKIINTDSGDRYMIGTLQDISDEKEHERQLKEKNAALQEMNKELESFAYISSHDLQEPLRKIQTFASRILDGEEERLSDNARGYFEKMQNAALRMQTLIDDLLAYSRTNSDEKIFDVVNLEEIMTEVCEELGEELDVYHAEIVLKNMEDLKIIPFQFKQILHNLVGNALKFSRREALPRIVIDSRNAPGADFPEVSLPPNIMYCHISVSDNGIGFENQYKDKIFDVFQRLHAKDKYIGTGIGLAIVKKIVENHEGVITADGNPGEGAVFNIYIPSA